MATLQIKAWVNDVKGVLKVNPITVGIEKARMRTEKDVARRIQLCEAFLLAHPDRGAECAQVEDLLAEALKQRGVEEAQRAYAIQMRGAQHPEYNPDHKFDLKHDVDPKKDLSDPTHSGLSKHEVLAVKFFSQSGYEFMNPAVANQKDKADKEVDWMDTNFAPKKEDYEGTDEEIEEYLKNEAIPEYKKGERKTKYEEGSLHSAVLLQAVKKLPKLAGKVYRGARLTPKQYQSTYAVGKTIVLESFASSSTDEITARNFASGSSWNPPADATVSVLAVADVVDARDIAPLSELSGEKEWLLLPQTQFQVMSIEDDRRQVVGNPPATAWKVVHMKQVVK